MSSRSLSDVVHAYLHTLQQDISCFGNQVVKASGFGVGSVHAVTTSGVTVDVITREEESLTFSFSQTFQLEQSSGRVWSVRTQSYSYSLDNANGREIIAFHWQPNPIGTGGVTYPHLHISDGAATKLRPEIQSIHFRTDRIAFEEFALMLIEDFEVVPNRDDATQLLHHNFEQFQKIRSW